MIPLKSVYRFDASIDIVSEYKEFDNALKLYVQPLYTNVTDSKFANKSYFALTPPTALTSFMSDTRTIDPLNLVTYTTIDIMTDTVKSLEMTSDYLYASSNSDLFKLIKRTDGAFHISKDDKYLTVVETPNGHMTKFIELSSDETLKNQLYDIEKVEDGYYTIKSEALSEYDGEPINRYLSVYNGTLPISAEGGIPLADMIMANGCFSSSSNPLEYVSDNPYKFRFNQNVENIALGFNGKIKWVKYYSAIFDKLFNKDVTIKDFIDTVTPNILVEYPINSQIEINGSVGTVGVNLVTLKNVMTPSYNYTIKGGN